MNAKITRMNMWFCDNLRNHCDLTGKRVLDVGCGYGELVKYISNRFPVEYITGIDLALSDWWGRAPSEGENWCAKDGNAEQLDFEDNSFDVVISFSTFEHIGDIPKALSEIRRVLKPYGKFYTEFDPLWTSATGHHFVACRSHFWNLETLAVIPAWGHLYMSAEEMRSHLAKSSIGIQVAEQAIEFIYNSKEINRISRTTLVNHIMNSAMLIRYYNERVSFNRMWSAFGSGLQNAESELSDEIIARISDTAYRLEDLPVTGMKICLEKYANL